MSDLKKLRIHLGSDAKISAAKYVLSLAATFALGAILIAMQGESPAAALSAIISGAFGSKVALGNTLHWAVPCILVGEAALVAFKSGVMNLGLEGQLYFGAFASACAGCFLTLPKGLHPVVCLLAGGLAGLLYALIPAVFKLFFKVDEVVATLLMNYIAIIATELFALMMIVGAKSLGTTNIMTPLISETAALTTIIPGTSATTGIFVALLVAALVWFLYKYTLTGYELKQVGENIRFAKAGGVNSKKIFLAIFLLSGFIAGLCGAAETTGVNKRFIASFSTNLGWDGVMITRVASNNPAGVVVVSLIWAAFKAGSLQLERVTSLNRYTINLLQALFVLFISIDYGMLYNKLKTRRARKKMIEGEA